MPAAEPGPGGSWGAGEGGRGEGYANAVLVRVTHACGMEKVNRTRYGHLKISYQELFCFIHFLFWGLAERYGEVHSCQSTWVTAQYAVVSCWRKKYALRAQVNIYASNKPHELAVALFSARHICSASRAWLSRNYTSDSRNNREICYHVRQRCICQTILKHTAAVALK